MWRSMQRGVKPAVAAFAWMKGGVSESWKPLPAAAQSTLCDGSHKNNTRTSVSLHVQCRDINHQSYGGHGIHLDPHNPHHPVAAQGSSFSTTNSSTSQKENAPDGRGTFTGLSLAHASLATAAFVVPGTVANALFPGVFVPQGLQTQALIQLAGCGLLGGAATCFALAKVPGSRDITRRLETALMGVSAGSIITHVLYSPLLSTSSLLSGVLIMGATFAVPFQSYKIQDGTTHLGSIMKDYFGALPDCFRIKSGGLPEFLYSILTPTLAITGAAYVFAPGYSLAGVFGYVKDAPSLFFWQNIGLALMTTAPAITYTLKREAAAGRLHDSSISRMLNFGLLGVSTGHLAVLLPMLVAGQGGSLLPWLAGAWSVGAAGAGLGLLKRR